MVAQLEVMPINKVTEEIKKERKMKDKEEEEVFLVYHTAQDEKK